MSPRKNMEDFKCLFLSERNQSEKTIYCMIPTIRIARKGKHIDIETVIGFQGFGGREEKRNEMFVKRIFRAVKLLYMKL